MVQVMVMMMVFDLEVLMEHLMDVYSVPMMEYYWVINLVSMMVVHLDLTMA